MCLAAAGEGNFSGRCGITPSLEFSQLEFRKMLERTEVPSKRDGKSVLIFSRPGLLLHYLCDALVEVFSKRLRDDKSEDQ